MQKRERTRTHGCVKKSRATGVTYICAAYATHALLFRPGFLFGFGSRKLDLVDSSNDPKAIFWKIRDVLYNLPEWMMPAGFNRRRHDSHARIWNPANGASIQGEGGDNIGRGGRASMYVLDEAAHVDQAEKVDAALSMNTNCLIYVSTPYGNDNAFATKCLSGKLPVFEMHWRHNPLLTEKAYEEYKKLWGPVMTAQEWDIDFNASAHGVCIPAAWVRAAVNLLDDFREHFANMPIEAGLDVGEEHDLAVYLSRQGPLVRLIDDWTGCTTMQTAYRARDLARIDGAGVLRYDAGGIGSGVKGPLTALEDDDALTFVAMPIMFGGEPTNTIWPIKDPHGRFLTSKQMFKNLRSEMWWALRVRFEKTYEFREKGIDHPPEELISIPDHPRLITDLSLPKYGHDISGKIVLQSKKEMSKSPDFGDAAVQAFAPVRVKEFWIR
jgi:hypothetical protein